MTRLDKAREIVKSVKLRERNGAWLVPSQSHKGSGYIVKFQHEDWTCNCPDFTARRVQCKHILAVCIVVTERETRTERTETVTSDGTKTVKTVTVTKEKRVTYSQNWPAYNAAQTQEKETFLRLLADLVSGVEEPVQTMGRPRAATADMIYASCFKVYSTVSARRFASELKASQEKGHIGKAPAYNTIFKYMETERLTPVLMQLIATSSLPLRAVETDFAVDSTGLSTTRFVRWYDAKYGNEMTWHAWIKLHLMCGVRTNIVTAVKVTDLRGADSPQLPELVQTTAERFTVREVSADKAYSAKRNLEAINTLGAFPFIPFKEGSVGGKHNTLWFKLFHLYSFSRDAFLEHYHKRSNVETVFHMIKSKFGDAIRSKTQTAQFNEALCKVLCHNICVVIQSMHELGISPDFQPVPTTTAA